MATRQLTIDVLLTRDERRAVLVADARSGLTASPKTLSPVWFYDERGGSLFDEITRLPEYYLTRAERGLLAEHADEIAALTAADTLVELGSGTSDKTTLLLDALTASTTLERYVPLDVDEDTLRAAATALAGAYPELEVHAVVGDFNRHLGQLPRGGRRLVAFLGSTIGNLAPGARRRFWFDLDAALDRADRALVGFDLVKDRARLLAAYNDASGITASFNRNALHVLNRTLQATFDPELFDHQATWNASEQWIEMRLRSRVDHHVSVHDLDLDLQFARGESLRTEISAKFTPAAIAAELGHGGFVIERTWYAAAGFVLVLARPAC